MIEFFCCVGKITIDFEPEVGKVDKWKDKLFRLKETVSFWYLHLYLHFDNISKIITYKPKCTYNVGTIYSVQIYFINLQMHDTSMMFRYCRHYFDE